LAIANDLMNLLTESSLIHSEAPYGYSTNSLDFKNGELVNKKTIEEYEYFIDTSMTDAERFKLAAPSITCSFGHCYDRKAPYWWGLCQNAVAATNPILHQKITSTKGLICPVKEGAVILGHMTLRELLTFSFGAEQQHPVFFGKRHWQDLQIDQKNPFIYEGLRPHEFHEKGHLALRNNVNFMIDVGPGELIFNRIVKSIDSKQTQIFDHEELIKLNVPSTHFPDKKIIYHVESDVYYYDYAVFHKPGGVYRWPLEYYIFIDPDNSANVDSFWIGPEKYSVEVEVDHNLDTYYLTKRPDMMWLIDWIKHELIPDPGLKAFLDLFDSCVQIDHANDLVSEALNLAAKINATGKLDESLLFKSRLDALKQEIQWFPLKSEIKDQLGLQGHSSL
jgi:hypothetical protein